MDKGTAIELVKADMNKFNGTRDIQWKMNISVWGLAVAVIYFFEKKNNNIDYNNGTIALMTILSLLFLFSHIIFIILTQRSLGVSKAIWNKLVEQLNQEHQSIKINIKKANEDFSFRPRDYWWICFQGMVTISLILAFVLLNAKFATCIG